MRALLGGTVARRPSAAWTALIRCPFPLLRKATRSDVHTVAYSEEADHAAKSGYERVAGAAVGDREYTADNHEDSAGDGSAGPWKFFITGGIRLARSRFLPAAD